MKKTMFGYIFVYFILIILFVLLLTLSSCLPSSVIKHNVQESSKILLKEGNRKIVYIPYRGINMQFDNYTDALMMNTAYSIDSKTPLYSAFVARKNYIPNVTTEVYQDTAGELRSSSKYQYHNEVGELNDLVNGEKAESFEYARYWHGYLVVLRPLLTLFHLTQIRALLTILLCILALILIYLIYKKINIIVSFIFFTGLLGIEYFYLGFSLQGIFVFIIMMVASIIILLKYNKIKSFGLYFFIIGMLVNFFDFLTVPIVTLSIPLVLYFLLKKEKEPENITEILKQMIQYTFAWGMGYALTWLTKWTLVDIFFNRNLIAVAINQVLYRSALTGSITEYSIFSVIKENISYIKIPLFISLMTTFLIISLNILRFKKLKIVRVNSEKLITNILPYLVISIFPICWYSILQNHSYYHAFFTYRNLIIINICLNIIIQEIFIESFKGEKNEK